MMQNNGKNVLIMCLYSISIEFLLVYYNIIILVQILQQFGQIIDIISYMCMIMISLSLVE